MLHGSSSWWLFLHVNSLVLQEPIRIACRDGLSCKDSYAFYEVSKRRALKVFGAEQVYAVKRHYRLITYVFGSCLIKVINELVEAMRQTE